MYTLVRQRDAKDCGPSCLAMIVKHYGRDFNIDSIRTVCSLNREGVSLLGISKAAETIGFKTVGGRLSFDTLAFEVPLPCIVHWNQNHFVVVYKIKKHKKGKYTVYVADPGKGLVSYTQEEFCEHWVSTKTNGEEKGVALLLEPTEQFKAARSSFGTISKSTRDSLRNSFSVCCSARSCNSFSPSSLKPSLIQV